MGGIASCTMTNKYSKKIWVKYDVEKKYVVMEDYTIEGQVGVGEVSVGASVSVSKTYDWVKIHAQFTPIPSGKFIELAVDCKDSKIMYVTIVAENGEVICNTLGKTDKNLIVTESGELLKAQEKKFTEVHPKYEKMNPTAPGPVNKKTMPASAGTTSTSGPVNKNTASAVTGNTITNRGGEQASVSVRRNISQLSAKKSGSIDVKSGIDRKSCNIMGMAVTDNYTLLLADSYNNNIKSVSPDGKVVSVLSLPESPMAITVVDTTTAVASAWDKKLYILDITNHTKLSVRGECQLEYMICAITHYNGNLVVTCDTDPNSAKMMTLTGEELWSVSKDVSGENLFSRSYGITSTTINDISVIVITDFGKNTLTLLEAESGRFIKTIAVKGEGPLGIKVANDGNVYVYYRNTREIYVWSPDFKESKNLVSRDELGEKPWQIVYSGVYDSLYVSYLGWSDKKNTVDCFRLG